MSRRILMLGPVLLVMAIGPVLAQEPPGDIRELKLRDWQPRSMMVTKTTLVERPRFPVIDVHNHLGGGKNRLTSAVVGRYLAEMDAAGVRTVVNLDGGWGDRLVETIEALDRAHPGRFLTFALVSFDGIDDEGWSRREAERLEASFQAGAKGLKFHKSLGLGIRYKDGRLMSVDDPKLDPIWEACARNKRPVVIHVADPAAFFTPLDRYNERWHELNQNPGWLFFGEKFPKRQDLLDQLHRVIAKHTKTTFINTHFGNNAEDLASVAEKLDKYPNMYVDIDARISELGRQPYSARKFFLKYQDRILFGTDTTSNRDAYRIYYRFLETDDESFDCSASHHLQGFWNIYGIFLPDSVLEKVYHANAERIFSGQNAIPSVAGATKELRVGTTEDFEVTGDGAAEVWRKAEWVSLQPRRAEGLPYAARAKLLYSRKGLYVLMDAEDKKLTSTFREDFADLWTEDVFEFFLWPDERDSLYFEYEISPLNRELPILVPNPDGRKFLGWRPWHYEGDRKVRKATSATGGPVESGASVKGWKAEVFLPFALLSPLRNVPPTPGTRWRANFYRMDYDDGKTSSWDWSRVGPSFHDFRNFGTLLFE
jgi:predicted TIM-barrel fold metal-dependent hydrolase